MKHFFLIFSLFVIVSTITYPQENNKQNWFEYHDFSASDFLNPSSEFAPFTRWWWPGGDVTQEELKREINLFADNHFGGVEIQPLALVMPTKGAGRADRIMSFDTPIYYENLFAVFEEARKRGLIVDMTCGSGWPSGGAHLTEEDNNITLGYGIIDIPKGNKSVLEIPRSERGDRPTAKLIVLLVAKATQDIDENNVTIHIDPKSVKNITANVKDSTFVYTPESDSWKAIAIWSMANMEQPGLIAKRNAGFAVNHFDSTKVIKNYNYYFGDRTGIEMYYGNPLRAIFNDSYEFKADRHFSDDFITTFKANRGYDIKPYLPVNIWIGYNNMYERIANPNHKPIFSYTARRLGGVRGSRMFARARMPQKSDRTFCGCTPRITPNRLLSAGI